MAKILIGSSRGNTRTVPVITLGLVDVASPSSPDPSPTTVVMDVINTGTVAVYDVFSQPELPREYIDTTYSLPVGGTTWYGYVEGADAPYNNATNTLQYCLTNCAQGDVIVLKAGSTYTGNFTIPYKVGTAWIYIISSDLASLPEGTRVGPADADHMPKIVTASSIGAFMTEFNAHHIRLSGVELSVGVSNYYVVQLGYGTDGGRVAARSAEELPYNITIDRCYIHSTYEGRAVSGVQANGFDIAVIDSYISNFKDSSMEGNAILIWNGGGPYKIVNNYLEGAAENVMIGGNCPTFADAIPSDIEIQKNYFFKPLAWIEAAWIVKNLIEFKNAQRVLINGNVFENCWVDSQDGVAIVITPRNPSPYTATWSVTQDMTFTNNIIRSFGKGVNMCAENNYSLSDYTKRILFENNLFQDMKRAYNNTNRFFYFTTANLNRPSKYITIRNNTFLCPHDEYNFAAFSFEYNYAMVDGFVLSNNIFTHGTYGPLAILTRTSNLTFRNNVIILDPVGTSQGYYTSFYTYYPNNLKAEELADVDFEDIDTGDYRLAATSPFKNAGTDGNDPGPNFTTLYAATVDE